LESELFINITETIDQGRSLRAHKSQMKDWDGRDQGLGG
jgi:hypothetical protein